MGSLDWAGFVQLIDGVHYETLRKAITGERLPKPAQPPGGFGRLRRQSRHSLQAASQATPLHLATPHRSPSIGMPATGQCAAFRTAAPAKPAQPPGGIANDAAALGYAPPLSEYRNAGEAGTASRRHRKRRRCTWLRPTALRV